MKNTMHAIYLAALGFGLLALTSEARADGGECEVGGTGTFVNTHTDFKLVATGTSTGTVTTGTVTTGTTTPISGHVELNSEDANGTTSDEVEILTRGLTPDTYTVAVTKISDSSTLTLGTFTVAAPTGTTTPTTRHREGNHNSVVFGTSYGQPLPAGFDSTDVATLTISSSAPAVVLSGTSASGRTETSTSTVVAITPGPLAISGTAAGEAAIESETENGKAEAEFSLYANGLPLSTTYTLAVNGTDVMSVTTDAKGRLKVHSLPSTVDVSTITSVTVHDATNALLLTATF